MKITTEDPVFVRFLLYMMFFYTFSIRVPHFSVRLSTNNSQANIVLYDVSYHKIFFFFLPMGSGRARPMQIAKKST